MRLVRETVIDWAETQVGVADNDEYHTHYGDPKKVLDTAWIARAGIITYSGINDEDEVDRQIDECEKSGLLRRKRGYLENEIRSAETNPRFYVVLSE